MSYGACGMGLVWLWMMDYEVWVMDCELWVMNYELFVMGYELWVMWYYVLWICVMEYGV